jgi:hypothetical protein
VTNPPYDPPARSVSPTDVARWWAAYAAIGAGLVHLSVVREHFDVWWAHGAFLLAAGVVQLCWGVLALARTRLLLPRSFAGVNAALVFVWLLSRTVGAPMGDQRWQVESVGLSDGLTVVLEIVVLAALAVAVRSSSRGVPSRTLTAKSSAATVALLFVGAVGVSALTVPALAASEAGEHAHHHGASHH